jgi:ankyrin repeat protein
MHVLCDGDAGVEIATMLVKAGADVNALDEKGRSPLTLAKARGLVQMISYLESVGEWR